MAGTLAALAEDLEERRYVDRADLSARVAALLERTGRQRVLVLHGPAGIGKSALLRDAARRARGAGYEVVWHDGRRLADEPILEDALDRSQPARRASVAVFVDEADALGAGLHSLGAWIGTLPATARVLVAGRARPEPGWLADSLQPLTATCRLGPLSDRQAHELLLRLGVGDGERAAAAVRWAAGSPLALVMAANAPDGLPAGTVAPAAIDELVERVAGAALDGADREALQAASTAWSVDGALLAAVLPHRDGPRCLERLVELDFVERLGDRAVVHPVVARAIVDRLRVEAPARARALTLRAASHLRDRAVAGDAAALADLAGLLRDPVLRAGLGPAFSERFYADRLRPADRERMRASAAREPSLPWPAIDRWLRPSPDGECFVARVGSGECVGVGVAVRASAAAGGRADELAGPLLELAAGLEQPERAVVSPFQLSFVDGDGRDELVRFMNAIAVMRCGVANPRYDIVNEIAWTDREREVAAGYGYAELPELRRSVGGREVRTWFADAGSAGLAGLVYHAIAGENGVELEAGQGWPDVVLGALDRFHDDRSLARLAVAPHGHERAFAAAAVRRRVRETVERALAGEPQLLAIVQARYLTARQTHDAAMRATFESRSSYFRKLRRARQAIAEAAAEASLPVGGPPGGAR